MLHGFTAQAALDAPRFCISPGVPDTETRKSNAAGCINGEVYFEEGIADETIAQLRGESAVTSHNSSLDTQTTPDTEMGHDARQVSGYQRSMFGRGQTIQRIVDASGRTVWAAGSDPRADGHAVPQI
jgi:gamma-glutamyltranspeptidase/glutathione hydrolase